MTIAMVMKQEPIVIVVRDDDYDEFEVVEIEHNGKKYFKDEKTNNIYVMENNYYKLIGTLDEVFYGEGKVI